MNNPEAFPPVQLTPPPERRGWSRWVVALLAIGGSLLACVCIGIVVIGVLTLLGQRVSQVFTTINSGVIVSPVPVTVRPANALHIGETSNGANLRTSVTSAHTVASTASGRKPRAGFEYWAVDVRFENTSQRVLTISAFTSALQDSGGIRYAYSSIAQRATGQIGLQVATPLRPGATLQGTLFYEVPQGVAPLFWTYTSPEEMEASLFVVKEQ